MLLLLVWIHGFKGTDNTFEEFPKRIAFSLSTSFPNDKVESLVYPAYRTAGKLEEAVSLFTEWLISNVAEREEALLQSESKSSDTGKPKAWAEREQAKVVLMAHSMGGLVAADTVLGLADTYKETGIPPWPRVVGIVAYDSPMLGLNPNTFSNTAQQYIDYASNAHQTVSAFSGGAGGLGALWGAATKNSSTSSRGSRSPGPSAAENEVVQAPQRGGGGGGGGGWWSAGALGGTLAVAAAAGLAWHQRGTISGLGVQSFSFVTDHLEFVGALWKKEELRKRLERIVAAGQLDDNSRAGFHCYFTLLPQQERNQEPRTFIILLRNREHFKRFEANQNSNAGNEVDAHVSMFSSKNDGGHALALGTVAKVCEFVGC